MKLRIKYHIPIEQIIKQISKLEKKSRINSKESDRLRALKQALSEYEESGETYFLEENASELSIKQLRQILTPKRLKILKHLNAQEFNSISALARTLNRDIKNIHQDLLILNKFNLIKKIKLGKSIAIKKNIEEINLEF